MNNKGFSPIHLILVLLIPAALITVFYVYFGNPFEKNEASYSEIPQEAYVLPVEETLYFDNEYNQYTNYELKVTLKFPSTVKYESGTDCGVITSPVMASYQSGTSAIFINSTRVNETVKLNHSFSEQASNRIKKLKDQTIYSNLKLTNPLLTTDLPKKYASYESQIDITNGYAYCKFNSVYAFQ